MRRIRPRADDLVLLFLGLVSACAIGFVVVFALGGIPHRTQLLGLALGLAFAFLAAACVVVDRRLVVAEERDEPYPEPGGNEYEQEAVVQVVHQSDTRITRRRLLVAGGAAAAGSLGLALIAPVLSLGRLFDTAPLLETPWQRGRRLVDEENRPLRAAAVEENVFYTAFPQGAGRETFGAPVIVVRLSPSQLRLPPERHGWAPEGILAYSKICTHAGCAIALYRKPTDPALEPRPAFVCPCHYSTFDPATGGTVLFGPAGRPLPQLPLLVDRSGVLRAAGNFSGPGRPVVVGSPDLEGAQHVIRAIVRFVDERSGGAPIIRKALRYLFPDHWSFLLGEIALYCFVILVATGVYLTLFFDPSTAPTVYHGSYAPLDGLEMSQAYRSVVDISFRIKAGLLIRQTHHWAADVFLVAIVLHLLRVFFTGAYRKPRDLTYYIGLTVLALTLIEGFIGYSLVDDLLSGMGLAIGYGVALSIPFVGANVASLLWGAPFPGASDFWPRMYIAHVLIIPVLIGGLLALHLLLVASRHHTQFRGPRRTERTLVGVPAFPVQAPRSLGLAFAVAAVLFLLGGLVQINPIWLWGPYHVASATNGAQPDWYLGWLIGALRLMPGWDFVVGRYTLVPNPFWGGVLLPGAVFAFLYLWPWLERRSTGEYGWFNLLERPRDRPWSTAIGCSVLSGVLIVLLAGSADRADVLFDISYSAQIWMYRVLLLVVPLAVLIVTKRMCDGLVAAEDVERSRRAAEAEARTGVYAQRPPGRRTT